MSLFKRNTDPSGSAGKQSSGAENTHPAESSWGLSALSRIHQWRDVMHTSIFGTESSDKSAGEQRHRDGSGHDVSRKSGEYVRNNTSSSMEESLKALRRGILMQQANLQQSPSAADSSDFSVVLDMSLPDPHSTGEVHEPAAAATPRKVQFVAHSPLVFSCVRDGFNISDADFRKGFEFDGFRALKPATSKSGRLFFITQDEQFILKSLVRDEAEFLQDILCTYYEHVSKHPQTLLPRYCGLYVLTEKGKEVIISVEANAFSSQCPIHERYDLKGSMVGRMTREDVKSRDSDVILKDLDLTGQLPLGRTNRSLLLHQLKHDCQFLENLEIVDYSMLLGVHHKANRYSRDLASAKAAAAAGSTSDAERKALGGEEDRTLQQHGVEGRQAERGKRTEVLLQGLLEGGGLGEELDTQVGPELVAKSGSRMNGGQDGVEVGGVVEWTGGKEGAINETEALYKKPECEESQEAEGSEGPARAFVDRGAPMGEEVPWSPDLERPTSVSFYGWKHVHELHCSDFDAKITFNPKKVMVLLVAAGDTKCAGLCRQAVEALDEALERETEGAGAEVTAVLLDLDGCSPHLVLSLRAFNLPTILCFSAGEEVMRIIGAPAQRAMADIVHRVAASKGGGEHGATREAGGGGGRARAWAAGPSVPVLRKDWNGIEGAEGDVYYFGIVDVLQPYTLKKQLEHSIKSLVQDKNKMTIVEPALYSQRFQAYIKSIVL